MWNALSDERTGLSFTISTGPRQRILRSESRGIHDHILLMARSPYFMSPKSKSKSKSKLCYDRRFGRPVCLGIKHPSGAYDQIFITVRQLQAC
jgi:hypothetical protein